MVFVSGVCGLFVVAFLFFRFRFFSTYSGGGMEKWAGMERGGNGKGWGMEKGREWKRGGNGKRGRKWTGEREWKRGREKDTFFAQNRAKGKKNMVWL